MRVYPITRIVHVDTIKAEGELVRPHVPPHVRPELTSLLELTYSPTNNPTPLRAYSKLTTYNPLLERTYPPPTSRLRLTYVSNPPGRDQLSQHPLPAYAPTCVYSIPALPPSIRSF